MNPGATEHSVRRSALVVATMASFLTPFLASAVNVALPAIGMSLHMNAVALSWVATTFILAAAVCLVPFGRVADAIGRKKVFLTGMIIFTLASVGCALAPNAMWLIVCRMLQGTGSAMIYGTGLAILTSVYPPGERGRVIGLNAAAVYTGLSVGPFLGGLMTQFWGWPSVFLVSALLGSATAWVAWRGLQGEWTGRTGGQFDFVGTLFYALALVALMTGLSAESGYTSILLVVLALLGLTVFVFWEFRVANPIIEVGLLTKNVVFARSNLAALINYSATFAVTFLLSLYLQYIRGLDPAHAGLILLTQAVVMASLSPVAGLLSDRLEPRIVASVGMGLSVLGLVWFCFIREQTSLVAIVAALVVLGAGFGLFSSPNTNAVMSSVGPKDYGVASATLGTMRLVGQMLSMGVAAAVLAGFVGHASITPELHQRFLAGLRVAFLISAVLCGVGVWASLSRGNVRSNDTASPR